MVIVTGICVRGHVCYEWCTRSVIRMRNAGHFALSCVWTWMHVCEVCDLLRRILSVQFIQQNYDLVVRCYFPFRSSFRRTLLSLLPSISHHHICIIAHCNIRLITTAIRCTIAIIVQSISVIVTNLPWDAAWNRGPFARTLLFYS